VNEEVSRLFSDIKEQILYLRELGAEDFAEIESPEIEAKSTIPQETAEKFVPASTVLKSEKAKPESIETKANRSAFLESTKLSRLSPLSESEFSAPDIPGIKIDQTPRETLFEIGETLPETGETIEAIRADIGNCTRCPLWEGRTQVVHSTGNFEADLMFVGEAPGADEDAQGFPFVGRAGQLLTKIIEGIQLKREDVFIGNINRCRPPGNRQPTLPEAETCRPFLLREIAVVKPKVIVVMGNTACQNLLNTKVGITKLRGSFHDYFGVKVMPTFHPAYLLRDPRKKREVWEDMKKVRDFLAK
jgi:DNA polymerase